MLESVMVSTTGLENRDTPETSVATRTGSFHRPDLPGKAKFEGKSDCGNRQSVDRSTLQLPQNRSSEISSFRAAALIELLEASHRHGGNPGYPAEAMLSACVMQFALGERYANAFLEMWPGTPILFRPSFF